MNHVDNSRWLDPPDEPTHWECDRCGCVFDGSDMTEENYKWYCDECHEIYLAEKEAEGG